MSTALEVMPSEYHSKLKLDRGDIFSKDSYLSKSSVFQLYQSSLYKWRYFPKSHKPTASMTWGSLVDCLVTAPEDFDSQFTINPYPSFKTKEAREWKDGMLANDINIVTEGMIEAAQRAAENLTQKHKVAAEIINGSKKQVVLVNRIKHPDFDKPFNMKALVDFVPNEGDFLYDLKTTNDFTPSGFEKAIASYGYHVQAAHYLNMWNALNPDDQRSRFGIIWQDSNAPYEVAVSEIPQVDIADGANLFNHLLTKILKAADKDHWPMRFPKPILLARASFGTYQEEQEMEGYVEAPATI